MNRIKRFMYDTMDYLGLLGMKKRLLLIGLQQSGKTSLIQQILHRGKWDIKKTCEPTTHPVHYEFSVSKQRWNCYDFSGNIECWKIYYPGADAIVFVVDHAKTDDDELKKVNDALQDVILGVKNINNNIPIAVLMNKMELSLDGVKSTEAPQPEAPSAAPATTPPQPQPSPAATLPTTIQYGLKLNPATNTIVRCPYHELKVTELLGQQPTPIKKNSALTAAPALPAAVPAGADAGSQAIVNQNSKTDESEATQKTDLTIKVSMSPPIKSFPCSVFQHNGVKEAFQWLNEKCSNNSK